ncbi:MAG: ribose transport system permease protein, partial [Pseudonocardiales bacterium]|nr:ribose transport system permease protein [Pseudonocardiales bacterium]
MTLFDQTNKPPGRENVVDGIDAPPPKAPAEPIANPVRVSKPAAPRAKATTMGDRFRSIGSRYALIGVWLVMAVVYSVLMPNKFLSTSTVQAIFGSQSALLFLAVAALCTFVVGEFDLSFASVMGLSATIIPVLSELHHVSLPLACLIALLAALGCGLLNAFFIVKIGVPSLIVTLGTASLFLGLAELISSSTIVSVTSKTFSNIALHNFLGLPLSFYYGLILCAAFAYVLTWMPIGRHIVFVGANREVARLAGISVDRIRAGSYIVASLVA